MANRGQIRNRILQLSEYAPDKTAADAGYYNWLNATIQDSYMQIWDEVSWRFSVKETNRIIRPDVSQAQNHLGSAIATPTLAVTNGSRTITFSQALCENWMPEENAKINILGREYNILKKTSTTVLEIEPQWEGNTAAITSALTDWEIYVRDYKLPDDCREVLDIAFTNRLIDGSPYGKIYSIPARNVISHNLNYETTQDKPDYYVSLPLNNQPADPYTAPAITLTGSSGFADGDYYLGWSILNSQTGVESEIMPLTVTVTSGPKTLRVAFAKVDKRGRNRRLYWGEKQDDGTFKYTPILNASATTYDPYGIRERILIPYDFTGNTDLTATSNLDVCRKEYEYYISHSGTQPFIRFYPRPQAKDYNKDANSTSSDKIQWAFFQLRYIFKPQEMKADTDVPAMPEAFHSLVVTKTLEQVYERLGNTGGVQVEAKRYKEKLDVLRARYASSSDEQVRIGNAWRSLGVGYGPTYKITSA